MAQPGSSLAKEVFTSDAFFSWNQNNRKQIRIVAHEREMCATQLGRAFEELFAQFSPANRHVSSLRPSRPPSTSRWAMVHNALRASLLSFPTPVRRNQDDAGR